MKQTISTAGDEKIENLKYDTSISVNCIKDVSILFDKNKKQYSLKIPLEVVNIFGIKRGDKFRFIVKVKEGEELVKTQFHIIKNDK